MMKKNGNNEEIRSLIKECFKDKKGMSEEQEKFLNENKGLLFEYYAQVSNPNCDSRILGNLEVWVYGDDRNNFTPHCHVMLHDKSVEVEISIIDWNVVNVKNGKFTKKMYKSFDKWLKSENSRFDGISNKQALFGAWDANNPNNNLVKFIVKHDINILDLDLKKYIKRQIKAIKQK